MIQPNQPKLQDLKNQAYALARSLGLRCTQAQHFKRRGLTTGLDLRTKSGWQYLIQRLNQMAHGVVVPLLKSQSLAA